MEKTRISFFKFLYAVIIGIVISVFSLGVSTVQAAEPQENVVAAEEEAPISDNADDGSSAVFLLMGGMLLIIIAVVVVVAAVSAITGPIADEL